MAYLKSDDNTALMVSQKYEQGAAEDDWASYQASLEVCDPIEVLTGSTTTLIKTTDVVAAGDTIYVKEGTGTAVVSGTVDGFTEKAWNISLAVYSQNFSVSSQETIPYALFFKPDGTKMYVIGSYGDDVNEYNLSTAWDISSAVYSQNFSVSSQESSPYALFFKPDGTKMYVMGAAGNDVNEYNLSVAWDVSSAVYSQNFYVGTQESSPTGLFFKPDGTKMYVMGTIGDDVNEYNLSTAWDVSSASYSQVFSVSAQETSPQALFFKPDGTKMYVMGNTGDDVNEYNLSTAWDVSSAVYSQVFSVSAQETSPRALFFKPDGTKMYVMGTDGSDVNEYDLDPNEIDITSFGLSSAPTAASKAPTVYLNTSFEADPDTCNCVDIALDVTSATTTEVVAEIDTTDTYWDLVSSGSIQAGDTLEMTVNSVVTDVVVSSVSVELSTEGLTTLGDITDFTYSQNFSVGSQETTPTTLFFKPDGTKMYVMGTVGADVNEYNLSTAWDVSSAVYSQVFSVSAQEIYPYALFFKPDGSKMYVTGTDGDAVNEYNLSTAWDVSSAVYSKNFSVAAQETQPRALFFKPDGTKMYVMGTAGADVNEYNLSTAWDVSSAVYSQVFSVSAQDTSPQALFFKPDGTKMYVIGISGQDVNEYNLSTAWDISSASYSQNFSVGSQETTPMALFFKPDGTKMYVMGISGDDVNEYTLSANTTIWDTAMDSIEFTITIPAQTHAPTAVTIPDRSVAETQASQVWGDDGKIIRTFDRQYKVGNRGLQYKLQANEDVEIHKVKYDLWRA